MSIQFYGARRLTTATARKALWAATQCSNTSSTNRERHVVLARLNSGIIQNNGMHPYETDDHLSFPLPYPRKETSIHVRKT